MKSTVRRKEVGYARECLNRGKESDPTGQGTERGEKRGRKKKEGEVGE